MAKRVIFLETDCHKLIDIINHFKHVIECKKTDSATWKDKIAAWIHIAEVYNASTTDPRTWEQLRCKYDNLKKDVRRHRAKLKQNLLQAGGDKIILRKSTEQLYDKVYKIISMSVDDLPSCKSDSDEVEFRTIDKGYEKLLVLADSKEERFSSAKNCHFDSVNDTFYPVVVDPTALTEEVTCTSEETTEPSSTPASVSSNKKIKDCRNHTLKIPRRKDLRSNKSKEKKELHEIKKKLLLEELRRNMETHKMKMKMEKELHALRIKESISKEISKLEKKKKELNKMILENRDIMEECEDEATTVPEEQQTPQRNSMPTNMLKRIDIPEILHANRQMKEGFEHLKDSKNDEYEMFGKLIASKLRTIKNLNTRDILMNDMHYMVLRACMTDRMMLPHHNQIHQSPLCSIFHSPLNRINQPCHPTLSGPPQNQMNEVSPDSMSSQSLQNHVYLSHTDSTRSVTPTPSPTDYKPSIDIDITDSCLVSNFPFKEDNE
ncbi:uncharacterized protein LOC123676280 isoform X1 [Harmonia axyridis]|uniref:uncharacterized protein LOC123676280 isoform X1 n=1 Tax=Harmonia axyridis TaxID=115357 RepID=UPI001E278D2B|nr:uncharacterized protein LOC123676280 isoform X1 [Harmonia axyridis]XP_045468046.1 uncharacterized protein LOC123676280 isoform X1 [Harmonia axyridis]